MKKLLVLHLLLLPCLALAEKPKPNPADYTITVHVVSSHGTVIGEQSGRQVLETIIDGQPAELDSGVVDITHGGGGLLPLGDYPSRLVAGPLDSDGPSTDIFRNYEFLLPDGTLRVYHLSRLGPASASPSH